ncbi:MAG TPA: DMT family transporter [Thermodesulfobacteriota bacterium]
MTVPLSGIVLLAVLTLAYGGNWVAMKAAVAEIPVWTFRSVCLVVGGAILLAAARLRGLSLAIPAGERGPLLRAALLNVTGWQICSAYGLLLMEAGRASIIGYTMPLWAVLLDRVLHGAPVSRPTAAALALGLVGLAALVGPDLVRLAAAPIGALFMLAAAVAWGAGTVVLQRHRWTMPTASLTAWQIVLGSLPVTAGALLLERSGLPGDMSAAATAGLAYATLVGIVFCHYLWFHLVRVLPPSVAAIGVIGVPIVGVLLSALVLGEAIGARELIALACVLPALAIVLIGPKRS